MLPHIELAITQLADRFTVRDIMVEATDLVRADIDDEAFQLLDRYPDFDHIPMPAQGTILAYLAREDHKVHQLHHSDLISDGTSLLMLPNLLVDRTFYFVLASNTVQGFVHFSDLNNELVKLPLFLLLEAVEGELASRIRDDLTIEVLREAFPSWAKRIKRQLDKAIRNKADRNIVDFLYFSEILSFARYRNALELNDDEQATIVDMRNRVAHSHLPLVDDHRGVEQLVRARRIVDSILNRT